MQGKSRVYVGVEVSAEEFERFEDAAKSAGRTVEEHALFILLGGDNHPTDTTQIAGE